MSLVWYTVDVRTIIKYVKKIDAIMVERALGFVRHCVSGTIFIILIA